MATTRKRGRPPAAKDAKGNPEKSSTWKKIAVTVRPSTKALLDAVCAIEKRAAWMVIEEGLMLYLDRLPREDRKMVDMIARRVQSPRKQG